MWNIWIDTGGTFTDCIALSPTGQRKSLKILSSSVLRGAIKKVKANQVLTHFSWPADSDIFKDFSFTCLATGIGAKVLSADLHTGWITLDRSFRQDEIHGEFEITSSEEVPVLAARLLTSTPLTEELPPLSMRLGSTKGTNALLEKKGAKVAFITTKGFEDLLVIRDQQRPHLFDLNIKTPPPIYAHVVGVEERIDSDGGVLQPIDIDKLKLELLNLPPETAIAICLLNSYKNNAHEKKVSHILTQMGFISISCSTDLSRQIKLLQRADTTVVNAYLEPIISEYIQGITTKIKRGKLWIMTSSGSIVDSKKFHPKDSLLSGPAGGIVGAVAVARKSGFDKIITFDMGGTSTDVAIYNGKYDYRFETKVGQANIQSPGLYIETIAAGGGSICGFKNGLLTVGPESAGASPGPACYGAGGPLTITDINLLAGRLVPKEFGIPVSITAAEKAINNLIEAIKALNGITYTEAELINAYTTIANEKMAEAIRKISLVKGHDPKEYCLISFGGAGGQHALGIAEALGIQTVAIPYEAGLLSAYGIGVADIEAFEEKLILNPWPVSAIQNDWKELRTKAFHKLEESGFKKNALRIKSKSYYLRFEGQENTLEIDASSENIMQAFRNEYQKIYGHWLENQQVELESIKLVAAAGSKAHLEKATLATAHSRIEPTGRQQTLTGKIWQQVATYQWEKLHPGVKIEEPSIITSENTTLNINRGWSMYLDSNNTAILSLNATTDKYGSDSQLGKVELFKNRYLSVVNDMGAILQRTSFSVNVKERMDFSCALLDAEGYLVANAPHIPVHLGSMGICVRRVAEALPMAEGDIAITNHPGFGGSHLPDVTLIAPVFYKGKLIAYVANRAHHSEIGGQTPGSMPVNATQLEEEGVVIAPQYIVKNGTAQWKDIKKLLVNAPYPTRAIDENLADLRGAVAALQNGIQSVIQLCDAHGVDEVTEHFHKLKKHIANCLRTYTQTYSGRHTATEYLDDGSPLQVAIHFHEKIIFDFSGSAATHPRNLNATEAIVSSVVLYVLRLLVKEDLPLNEGLFENVEIINPTGLLNPDFNQTALPAVVGGNTEVSQRLTDTLLKALGLAACSQGTMNNLLFGNESFGYYETICGGSGAGESFHGHDAIHQHMTNTKITDPEIIEHRYPVRVEKFAVRKDSGGQGRFNGGNGIIRSFTFLDNLQLTLLTQHRKEAPYGMRGGEGGKIGRQYLEQSGERAELNGIANVEVKKGDKLTIKTPGGGGWGSG
ncbi:MAG: hydantoinase B/oxoprolinase family protein [Bacteroidota bacterium]